MSSNSGEVSTNTHSRPIIRNERVIHLKEKVVLFAATKFFGHPITTSRFMEHCPEKHSYCRISEDYKDYPTSDVAIFHNADYANSPNRDKMLQNRIGSIPFVLWSLESPSNDHFRPESNVINWTMTFRKDADIFTPYGRLVKLEKEITVDFEKIWEMKTGMATILASNCFTRNKRMKILEKMKGSGVEMDIWGGCGKRPVQCEGVDNQESPCVVDLLKKYKFYMSIENSNCKNYVTEKFWKALGERTMIPVVLSRKYYKELDVPDSAYIAIDDFSSISDAAAHIKKVAIDKDLYLSYHQWRKSWGVDIHGGFSGFCQLCDLVRDKNYVENHAKSYQDVQRWHSEGSCDNTIADKFL